MALILQEFWVGFYNCNFYHFDFLILRKFIIWYFSVARDWVRLYSRKQVFLFSTCSSFFVVFDTFRHFLIHFGSYWYFLVHVGIFIFCHSVKRKLTKPIFRSVFVERWPWLPSSPKNYDHHNRHHHHHHRCRPDEYFHYHHHDRHQSSLLHQRPHSGEVLFDQMPN